MIHPLGSDRPTMTAAPPALQAAAPAAPAVRRESPRRGLVAVVSLALVAVGASVWGLALTDQGVTAGGTLRLIVVCAWALAGVVVTVRRPRERLGLLMACAAFLGGAASFGSDALRAEADGREVAGAVVQFAGIVRALAVALLPALGMHLLLSLPDGRCRVGRTALVCGYAGATLVGVVLATQRPSLPLWPVVVEAVVAGTVGLAGSHRHYRRARGVERQRMQWFGWAVLVGAEVLVVTIALRLLGGWPEHGVAVAAAAATLPIPLALLLGSSRRVLGRIDHLLARTVSLAGLSVVVVGVYVLVVLGFGRAPNDRERSFLLLSMVAAALSALLYAPARERLSRFANRLAYGEREAPDTVLRTFGSRLSRAVPLDELLLQVAESLRKVLGLTASEIWTGSDGRLERCVSVPDRPVTVLNLARDEEAVVSRAGVSGQAWARVWVPELLRGRETAILRVAPVAHSGHLLGLIVAVRPEDGDVFGDEDDRMLTELARQVGLALHNVELDSALQASLDEVRRQADELQASRARIVAASDAARRRIERDLHDGAQQHLVALAVNLRLARQVAESSPETAQEMLDQLGRDLQDAVSELRRLAHGIYPPLLVDRGLVEALSAAVGRASLPARVEADGLRRYPPEVEAVVYFCCLEALQNAGKHAGEGATVTVCVKEEAGGLLFEVVDDGAGFDQAGRAEVGAGAGFVNMADRVGAIGGSVTVQSAPGEGTRVSGRIPLTG